MFTEWQSMNIECRVVFTEWQSMNTGCRVVFMGWQSMNMEWRVMFTEWQSMNMERRIMFREWQSMNTECRVMFIGWQSMNANPSHNHQIHRALRLKTKSPQARLLMPAAFPCLWPFSQSATLCDYFSFFPSAE